MSCDCSLDYGEYNTPEPYSSEIRTARKPHTCCECGEVIQPGELYEYVSGKWDGNWHTYRTCLPCSQIRQDYCGGGWIYGGLVERLSDCLGFDYRTFPEGEVNHE